jgi:DNA-binding transcriptional regulator YhcF (GntR family)
MAQDPDDKRAYFQRIVDDITAQIEDGRLQPNDPLPSARKMADIYGVASMTAQRALRELQHLRITYGVPGKGTFIHPDANDVLRGDALREPIDDPDLRQRVGDYLAVQQHIVTRLNNRRDPDDRDAALADLLAHAERHRDLIDEAIKYQSDRGNFAKDPIAQRRQPEPASEAPSKPTKATARKRATKARPTASDGRAG